MGHVPEQSVARSVQYARSQRLERASPLCFPEGDYGQKGVQRLAELAAASYGGNLVGFERYARGNTSIVGAAQRLRQRGGYDTVLIADSARGLRFKPPVSCAAKVRGRNAPFGDGIVERRKRPSHNPKRVEGALFSAVSDRRFRRFSESYEARFGTKAVSHCDAWL